MNCPHLFCRVAMLLFVATASHAAELTMQTINSEGRPIPDAVATLIPLDPMPASPVTSSAEISQNAQEYTNYVTVVQAGTKVIFPNQDSVQHHVYSLSKPKKFEFPLYNPGQAESVVFDVSGIVTLGCNIHDWMVAYVLIVPTPYFNKTSADGTTLVTAPAGRYRLEVWHPRLAKTQSEEIVLSEVAPLSKNFTLTLKPDRRIRRGPVSRNGGY